MRDKRDHGLRAARACLIRFVRPVPWTHLSSPSYSLADIFSDRDATLPSGRLTVKLSARSVKRLLRY
jgi:hypothetical protein